MSQVSLMMMMISGSSSSSTCILFPPPQPRSLFTVALQAFVLATCLLLLLSPMAHVEAGKKEKLLLGLAVGHALSSRARDHSLLRLIIPLRMATEAWKHFGEATHGHHHYEHGHHGYGGHHHGFHFDLEGHDHFKA